ncbi:hypothetical protein SGUI_0746 [Serinicoccus hydrothermalis]|uniref:Uncharacterized protein n=1 Tax=Serinicoccus hydrothermalis TaxID=1758689 RepID=A0A1B1N9N0_9MICO|nr:hypothetical protein [Serinicoccus hydrothermalis]ANS78142.1 hypothetical protein SGUI_0746 [Serinicoccus hydrothermalis]
MVGGEPAELRRCGRDLAAVSGTLGAGRSRLLAGGGMPAPGLGLASQDTQVAAAYDRVLRAVELAAGHLQRTLLHDAGHLEQAAGDLEASPSPREIRPEPGEDRGPVLGRAEPYGPGRRLPVDRDELRDLPRAAPYRTGPALVTDEPDRPDLRDLPRAEPYRRGPALDTEDPGTVS